MHARQYLEKAYLRRRKVYFVVGLEKFMDARLETNSHNTSSIGGKVTAPGELVLGAATGVPLPLGEIPDVAVDSQRKKSNKGLSYFFAEGEQVFALRYRKVDFRWFSKGNVADEAELKDKVVRTSFWSRGEVEEEEEEEDAIADVTQELEASDLGRDAEVVIYEDSTFLFA
ncbi:hypothetical protein MMC14_008738 [Varicellaria rhodocarpa]|nr:hypothetical protein [Varicellaria rhodocarpa]